MHKLREISGCDFVKFRPFLEVFSRISPLGNTPKMTIRKSAPASEFLENFIEKRVFFTKKCYFWKKPADLTRKRREKLAAIFCIFEKSGEFFRFWISEAATLLDDFEKYMKNFNLWFFTKKSWWAEKGEFHFFKKRVFSQKPFLRFLLWRAYAKMKK